MSVIGVGQAVILGVVEGVTEFLPISSTGHLKIAEGLLGIPVQDAAVVGFTAVIQMGAIAAVLVYFFADLRRFVVAWGRGLAHREARRDRDYRFAWWVVFATVPIVVAGLLCQPLIKGPLGSLWVVAGALIVGSGVMWVAERVGTQARSEDDATLRDVMLVGTSQILALLFPGFSRSGATIATALLCNLDRVAATRMSFFLSIPALTGAGLYELKDAVGGPVEVLPVLVGTVVSFVVAYASIAWLLRYVARHTFGVFIVYRILLGAALFALLGTGILTD
ncbi:undecaprenyl-diphosphate phosphatase (plasmid) [Mycolicibacterium rufum]|uniref:Undecaprenyl-diphosphatase n=1 Tax=Mycolicibacterium rufum TaxID=318424 RepID=A0A9X2YD50_9MYCO|nr:MULTISPECIES: undecaprenyl-diphosphate phosphatase [Mycobacteriaceae]KGI66010.1 UDP pyrophosphate phosphatase [Mycolicibacterium rufum]MCV7071819.1 undecaprenyl-diphosphate phosphatase [Mycolicibacterium rufum]MDO3208813.1 undecaprenyl-diphosphate phosphatase [Mycobacteroides abscessus subsp. massiliense]ULP40036.1 undecaprenyl-diphosphate phosphatase [Mycolicibacterium rufum]